jgi:hypothetical protein
MYLVIDKDFLQGSRLETIQQLAIEHQLIMTHGLFFELLTGEPEERAKCFSHLPKVENPLLRCEPTGKLIQNEIASKRPSSSSDYFLSKDFHFNPNMCRPDYNIESVHPKALAEWRQQNNARVQAFLSNAQTLPHLFPGIIKDTGHGIIGRLVQDTIMRLSTNHSEIKRVFELIRSTEYPSPEEIDDQWVLFRDLQTQLLYLLRYLLDFGVSPIAINFENIEHDLHDMECCVIGSFTMKIATRDKKLKGMYEKICPKGEIVS